MHENYVLKYWVKCVLPGVDGCSFDSLNAPLRSFETPEEVRAFVKHFESLLPVGLTVEAELTAAVSGFKLYWDGIKDMFDY